MSSVATNRPAVRLGTVRPSSSSAARARWTVLGLVPASMARSRTEGIFWPGFHVPSVMRARKLSASWIQMGRVSSMRSDASLLSCCINTLIQ